jgi:DNA-binding MarR family transcriptional regulator
MLQETQNFQDIELMVLFHQAYVVMARAIDNDLRSTGISAAQAGILFFLKTSTEPVTPSAISRWINRKPHTVKASLDRLEKKGFITRVKDLPKKNLIRVILTDKGDEVLQTVLQVLEIRAWRSLMSSLPNVSTSDMRKILESIRDNALREAEGPLKKS